MARTVRTKVYKFSELSETAKEKAIEWYLQASESDNYWFEYIDDDAKEIGLKITDLNDYSAKGEFTKDARTVADLILESHGKDCETFKTATTFINDLNDVEAKLPVKWDDDADEDTNQYDRDFQIEELEIAFKESLLEDYRIMANKEYEYVNSSEYAKEQIEANEYEFTQDGRRF